jgi:uncharacterized protein YecE (DUF72 family)
VAANVSNLFIATAGWTVPRQFAHLTVSDGSSLERYASVFRGSEINSTFSHRHQPKTFERWRNSVPNSFRFAVKLPRAITHEAQLAAPRANLALFFDDVRGLADKLGPILVQLPGSFQFSARRVAAFFRALRTFYSGPVACEPRHSSWYGADATDVFIDYGVARVIADPPRPEQARFPAGVDSLRYVRWHGSPHVYRSSYDDERLAALAQFIAREPPATTVWCVFDNTASGAAMGDAHRLRAMLAEPATAVQGDAVRVGNARLGERSPVAKPE